MLGNGLGFLRLAAYIIVLLQEICRPRSAILYCIQITIYVSGVGKYDSW